ASASRPGRPHASRGADPPAGQDHADRDGHVPAVPPATRLRSGAKTGVAREVRVLRVDLAEQLVERPRRHIAAHLAEEVVLFTREPDRGQISLTLSGRAIAWVLTEVDRARFEQVGGLQFPNHADKVTRVGSPIPGDEGEALPPPRRATHLQ